MRQVYLDHQAATPLLPEAREAMRPFLTDDFGAPASLHRLGLRARDALEQARAQVAGFLGAEFPEEIIFTSDGTESANLAIKGAMWANERRGRHLVISATEHPSVLNAAAFLEAQGFDVARVAPDRRGMLDPGSIRAALTDKTTLIAVHHVNHDIGAVQPIRDIAEIAAERGIAFYVDADASVGCLPVDVRALGATLLSFSAPRLYGPKGVGILYRNRRARLTPLLHGGEQEGGRRAGLENVAGIVGTGVAAEIASRELSTRQEWQFTLQRRLWKGLRSSIPRVHLNGPEPGEGRSPANLNVSVEGIEGEGLALLADMHGLAIGAGTACVSKALGIAPTLQAIGLGTALAKAAVIFSLGKDNTEDEIDHALELLPRLIHQLRSLSPDWKGVKPAEGP